MNREDAKTLVTQLQQAHRLSVAFYRRILPTFDTIANHFECEFWNWDPLHTSKPGRSTTQPSSSWAWDYVPLYASSHIYGRCEAEKQTSTNDLAIKFLLYIEDSFEPSKRGTKGQPDPLSLPEGNAVVKVWLYRPKADYKKPFDDLWDEKDHADPQTGKWSSVSEHFAGLALNDWALEDVICDIQPLVDELKTHIPK